MGEVRRETFEVGGEAKVELQNLPSGHASFVPGESGKVEVEIRGAQAEEFRIEHFGERVTLRAPEGGSTRWRSYDVAVRVPEGANVEASTASADVSVEAEVGSLGVNTASGSVRGRRVRKDARVNTSSGDVRLQSVGGNLGLNSASGDARVGEVQGHAGMTSASGDLSIGAAHAGVELRSASGDLQVESFAGSSLDCATQSGSVGISVPPGRTLRVDIQTISGDILSELQTDGGADDETPADTARLRVRTISGDITLARSDPNA